jgi:putative transposase
METETEGGAHAKCAQYHAHVLRAIAKAVDAQQMTLAARQFVEGALKSPNAQGRPQGRIVGRFTSDRMGVSMAFSHGFLGIAAAEELEHDPAATAFFDYPPQIKLSYTKSQRKVSHLFRVPLLVVRQDRTVLITLMEEKALRASEAGGSDLFRCSDGTWTCPSAAQQAAKLGFEHEVWSETRFLRQHVANLKLLSDFYGEQALDEEEEARIEVLKRTAEQLGAPTCHELLEKLGPTGGVDDLFRAITRGRVFVDLQHADLRRYDAVHVFVDRAILRASIEADKAIAKAADWEPAYMRTLCEYDEVTWDGTVAEVISAGPTGCTFRVNGSVRPLTHEDIETLRDSGAMKLLQGAQNLQEARRRDSLDRLVAASHKDLVSATARLRRIEPYLAGLKKSPASRTLRRYLANYRRYEETCGNGFIGLLPRYGGVGERARKLGEGVLKIVKDNVETRYADVRNLSRLRVYGDIEKECEEKGLPAPSYSWFCRHLKSLDQYWLKTAREGKKASYPDSPRRPQTQEELTVDIEPVRVWERAHIDHTQIDLETIFTDTGENLGRAWLTVMIDHFSRRILGFSISYEPPSYRACLLTFRDCVRRFSRLPNEVVVDGGKEFRSVWFESLCAFYSVTVIRRPARKPRYGTQIERFFGSENTMLLHNLVGNTQVTKNVRQMTPAIDPAKLAIWTLPRLYPLHEKFLFDVYEGLPNRDLMMSPRQASDKSTAMFGMRPGRHIEYCAKFLLVTCPSTRKGKAKVTANGVKINYFWFNAEELFAHRGKSVRVKFEPYDLSIAYAKVGNNWVRLRSRFQRTLQGLSERELFLVTEEYRKRRGQVEATRLTDLKLVRFLQEVEKEEAFLLNRKRALELQRALESTSETDPATASNFGSSLTESVESIGVGDEDDLDIDMDDVELEDLETY